MPSFGYNSTSTQQNPNSTQPQLNSTSTQLNFTSTQPKLNSTPTQLNFNSTPTQLNPKSTQPQIKSTPTKFQLDLISTSTSTSIQPYFNLKLKSTSASISTQHGCDIKATQSCFWQVLVFLSLIFPSLGSETSLIFKILGLKRFVRTLGLSLRRLG